MNGELPIYEDNDELTQELKDCAFTALLENPHSDYGDWQNILIHQYPAEVVDALGTEPLEVYATLAQWWDEMDYEDPSTGLCKTYREWADTFSSEGAADLYRELADANEEKENLIAQIKYLKSLLKND